MWKKLEPGLIALAIIFVVFVVYWTFREDIGFSRWIDLFTQTSSLALGFYLAFRQGESLKDIRAESFKQFARERYRCLLSMNEDITTVRIDVSDTFGYRRDEESKSNRRELSLLKRCEDLFRRLDDRIEKDLESWNDYAYREVKDIHEGIVEKNRQLKESLDKQMSSLEVKKSEM